VVVAQAMQTNNDRCFGVRTGPSHGGQRSRRGKKAVQFSRRIEGQQCCRRTGSAWLVFTQGWSERRGPHLLRHLVFRQTAQSLGVLVLYTTLGKRVHRLPLCNTYIRGISPLVAVLDLDST
jgi:hypothetical protein